MNVLTIAINYLPFMAYTMFETVGGEEEEEEEEEEERGGGGGRGRRGREGG